MNIFIIAIFCCFGTTYSLNCREYSTGDPIALTTNCKNAFCYTLWMRNNDKDTFILGCADELKPDNIGGTICKESGVQILNVGTLYCCDQNMCNMVQAYGLSTTSHTSTVTSSSSSPISNFPSTSMTDGNILQCRQFSTGDPTTIMIDCANNFCFTLWLKDGNSDLFVLGCSNLLIPDINGDNLCKEDGIQNVNYNNGINGTLYCCGLNLCNIMPKDDSSTSSTTMMTTTSSASSKASFKNFIFVLLISSYQLTQFYAFNMVENAFLE